MPAIGYLCVFYAHLEARVDELIGQLTDVNGDKLHCITNEIDLRVKLNMLKHLAFVHQPEGQWVQDVHLVIAAIQRKIGPDRNRFIHDRWREGVTGSALRRYSRNKINQPQAKRPHEFTAYEDKEVSADTVWDLVEATIHVSGSVDWLRGSLKTARSGTLPAGLPQSLRDQCQALLPQSGGDK
jgi:hypothetical protein